MEYRGQNGQIELLEERLIIRRGGFLSFFTHGFKGDKSIPFASISAVQFRVAGTFVAGYIQFTIRGGIDAGHGVTEATYDENTVMFGDSQNIAFAALRTIVEDKIAAAARPPGAAPPSAADEIKKLAGLRDRGILTEEEFRQRKRTVLGC